MDNKKFSYIITLTKRQFILSGSIFFFLVSIIFFSGYLLGLLKKNDSMPNPDLINNSNNKNPLVINDQSEIVFEDNLSSSDILNLENPKKKSPQNKIISTKKKASVYQPLVASQKRNIQKKNKFYLQVIATANKEKAKKIKKKFLQKNYPVFVLTEKKKNRNLYMVRVGYFYNKKNALKHLKIIRGKSPYKETFIKQVNKI